MQSSPLKFDQNPHLLQCLSFESQFDGDFLKFGSISPDGSTLLSLSEGNVIETVEMDTDKLHGFKFYGDGGDKSKVNSVDRNRKQLSVGESVYDCKWYPLMNIQDDNTNCFVTTCRDHPITLWDAPAGTVRATYSGINHLDELDAATSLSFNMAGDKIYTGSNRMIRCFDISQPGRRFTAIPTTKNRKSPLGQKGLISAISFNPDYSGLYAAGSYANSIGLYVENSRESVMQLDQLPYGVTCLRWSPCGKYLWAGGRNSDKIQCWDIRSSGSCIGEVKRNLNSQQRMTFDIDPWGDYLATGSEDGQVRVYSTKSFELINQFSNSTGSESSSCSSSCGGGVCVNTVLFHPFYSLLYSVQGVRSFQGIGELDSDSELENELVMQVEEPLDSVSKKRKYQPPVSALSLWSVDFTPLPLPATSSSESGAGEAAATNE